MATGIVESAFVASPVWLRCDFVDDAVERSTDGVAALEYICMIALLPANLVRVFAATWGSQFVSEVAIVKTDVQELSRNTVPGEPKPPCMTTYNYNLFNLHGRGYVHVR